METSKVCERCARSFTKRPTTSQKNWTAARYCSRACHNADQQERAAAKLASKTCEGCGRKFSRPRRYADAIWTARRFCSTMCAYASRKGTQMGAAHPSWKGGRIEHDGYIRLRRNGRYEMEHRLVMEQALGRPLDPYETVHHRNGVRDDNRLENLELRQGRHGRGAELCCGDCGSTNIVSKPVDGVPDRRDSR